MAVVKDRMRDQIAAMAHAEMGMIRASSLLTSEQKAKVIRMLEERADEALKALDEEEAA